MKQVYSNRNDIAMLWALKMQPSARNPRRNFYFEGDMIFSYGGHFCVARHVQHGDNRCVFLNIKDYGNTTARHKQAVRKALWNINIPKFYVQNPERTDHPAALNYFSWCVKMFGHKAAFARKPDQYIASANMHVRQFNEYARFFGLGDRLEDITLEQMLEKHDAERKRAFKKRSAKARKTHANNVRELICNDL